jgi:PIN domain nuclease of toxin-antitoxin system
MIILDTHIWIWWVDNNAKLNQRQRELINTYQSRRLGISIISCWEVAKLVENKSWINTHASINTHWHNRL